MILTFQITDAALSILKDELRVSREDYNAAATGSPSVTSKEAYARRILRARRMLELSVWEQDACYED